MTLLASQNWHGFKLSSFPVGWNFDKVSKKNCLPVYFWKKIRENGSPWFIRIPLLKPISINCFTKFCRVRLFQHLTTAKSKLIKIKNLILDWTYSLAKTSDTKISSIFTRSKNNEHLYNCRSISAKPVDSQCQRKGYRKTRKKPKSRRLFRKLFFILISVSCEIIRKKWGTPIMNWSVVGRNRYETSWYLRRSFYD